MAFRELTVAAKRSVVVLIIVSHLQGMVNGKLESLRHPGDTVIGSIEPVCVPTASSSCGDIDINGLLKVEAIIYAVENANKRAKELGLNGTLGYEILDSAQKGTHQALLDLTVTHEKPRNKPIAVLGILNLESKDNLFFLLSQELPHISCDVSTSVATNDYIAKSELVFWVYPSDRTSIKAMIHFIAENKWSYIGAVTDHSGSSMLSVLKEEGTRNDICVGAVYTLPNNATQQQIAHFMRTLNAEKNYTVIVALTTNALTRKILAEASKQKVKGLTWVVGQQAWPNTRPIPQPNSASQGMFSVLSQKRSTGFVDHLRSLTSGNKKIENIWLRELASSPTPSTAITPIPTNDSSSANATTQAPVPVAPTVTPTSPSCNYDVDPMCGMDRNKLKATVDKMIGIVENSACTIDAVLTVAHALADKQRCMKSSECTQDVNKFQDFIRRLDFTNSLTDSRISFTPHGYLNYTLYHIYNYQQNYSRISTHLNKDLKAVDVGTWAYSPEIQPTLKVSEKRIEWHGGHAKGPTSRCHQECQPSKYRALKKDRVGAECCWHNCQKCPKDTYSDTKDAIRCKKCPKTHRASVSQVECILYYEDYVHWDHGGSLFLLFVMVVGLCFSLYVSFVLFRNSDTPIMKKAKSAMLCLLPFAVLLFLLPIPLLGRPTESSCEGYRIFFLISLGIPLAVLLAKSHFFDNRCKDQSQNGNHVCTPRLSIVCFIVLCHILVAVVLALVIPAKVNRLSTEDPYTVFLECSYHSSHEFLIVIFYTMFLAVLVSIFSLNEVVSKENYFEVRWISMAMFNWYAITFFYVVFTFGVHAHAKIIMLGLMDILYAVNIFGLLYVPKWFIVVFKPEKNRSDVSPWTDYIKTQERVSERLSAPEDSPIMTKKGKTGENDETPEAKGLMTDTDI